MECNIRFGCMIFDDPANPDSGWASIAGSKPILVDNVSNLDTDVLWWTNLSYKTMYNDSKVGVSAMMRHDKYLILPPIECLKEWGYDHNTLTLSWISNFISRVFDKIMKMAWTMIVDACPGIHPKDVFCCRELRQDMSRIFPEPVWPKGEAAAVCKRGYGFTEFTMTTHSSSRGNTVIKLCRNRLIHALDILSTPIPNCDFEFVSGSDIGSNPREVIMNSKVPWFSEVSLKNIDSEASTILAFGTSMDKKNRIMRTWVPHPELISINPIADIDIKNAYRGKEYTILANLLPDSVIEFMNNPFSFLSWSAGVLAETLWKAAALKDTKANPDEGHVPDTSWRGLWIKSIDKTLTFVSALEMNDYGWIPVYYGSGGISYSCPANRLNNLITDGGLCGVLPRMGDIPSDFNCNSYNWNGDKRANVNSRLTISAASTLTDTKSRGKLWNLDKIPSLPKNQRKSAFDKIQQAKERE